MLYADLISKLQLSDLLDGFENRDKIFEIHGSYKCDHRATSIVGQRPYVDCLSHLQIPVVNVCANVSP